MSLNSGLTLSGAVTDNFMMNFYVDVEDNFSIQFNAFQTHLYLRKDYPTTVSNYTILDSNIYPTSRTITIDGCKFPGIVITGRWYIGVFRESPKSTFAIQAILCDPNLMNVTFIEKQQLVSGIAYSNNYQYYALSVPTEKAPDVQLVYVSILSSARLKLYGKVSKLFSSRLFRGY